MKLLSLQCDRPSFKQLDFRPEGLSVVVGDAGEPGSSANGVGKTLALKLVHHCLGARRDKTLAHGVGDWRFALEFMLGDTRHRIERNGDGSDITLDGRAMSERGLQQWLDECGPFALPKDTPGFSFRALYKRFARKDREGDFIDPVGVYREQEHEALVRALYLLGCDTILAQRKVELREQVLQIDNARKLLKTSDARLRELLRTGIDVQGQLADLQDRIARLRTELDAMQVAENYETVRQEADRLTQQLREREARLAQIDFQLAGIERALQPREDITREAMLGFYQGLQHVFKPEALQHFEAVESFHRSLLEQRQRRLHNDRFKLLGERERFEEERKALARERDARLAFLQQHRALDDYMAVAERLARLQADYALLAQYRTAVQQWDEEMLALRQAATQNDKQADEYAASRPLAWADQRFRQLVHILYPNEAAAIVLANNTGHNKLRYDLKVEIQGQGSDGINAVRIMVFDWIVYRHGTHHTMRHLWHDNALFDHVHPSQRAAWFELTHRELAGSGMQYVISINTENYASTRSLLGEKGAWLDAAVIARLSGDADAHKLLGARIGVDAGK